MSGGLDVELREVPHFDVTMAGKPLGLFRKVSSWEGLAKLENSDGDVLLIVEPSSVPAAIAWAFGSSSMATLVMASPNVYGKATAPAPSAEAAP